MTDISTETRSVVVEREVSYPPEKIWRALTTPHLIAEWLMKNDFAPVMGHRFQLSGDWGAADCKVTALDPDRTLAYTWDAMGLKSVVTWTLTPTATGTHLRVEQAGFPQDNERAYRGATFGWQSFVGKLADVLARLD